MADWLIAFVAVRRSRSHRRHSGVALVAVLSLALRWAGWHYSHPTPPPGGAPEPIERP